MRIVFLLASVAFFLGCFNMGPHIKGNGRITTQKRTITPFQNISVGGNYRVILSQTHGEPGSVSVETDENLLDYIITSTEGNSLKVHTKKGFNIDPTKEIVLYISAPFFDKVSGSGSCDISNEGRIDQVQPLYLVISGSGKGHFDIKCPSIDLDGSGSCDMILSGETKDVTVSGSGSVEIKSYDLLAENVSISISGSGNANVFASKSLKVSVSGSGDVTYKGNPVVEQHISGSGSVKKVD